MVLAKDREQVRIILSDTISMLCKNGLNFNSELSIDALIGITVDHDEVFLVSVKETYQAEASQSQNVEKFTSRRHLSPDRQPCRLPKPKSSSHSSRHSSASFSKCQSTFSSSDNMRAFQNASISNAVNNLSGLADIQRPVMESTSAPWDSLKKTPSNYNSTCSKRLRLEPTCPIALPVASESVALPEIIDGATEAATGESATVNITAKAAGMLFDSSFHDAENECTMAEPDVKFDVLASEEMSGESALSTERLFTGADHSDNISLTADSSPFHPVIEANPTTSHLKKNINSNVIGTVFNDTFTSVPNEKNSAPAAKGNWISRKIRLKVNSSNTEQNKQDPSQMNQPFQVKKERLSPEPVSIIPNGIRDETSEPTDLSSGISKPPMEKVPDFWSTAEDGAFDSPVLAEQLKWTDFQAMLNKNWKRNHVDVWSMTTSARSMIQTWNGSEDFEYHRLMGECIHAILLYDGRFVPVRDIQRLRLSNLTSNEIRSAMEFLNSHNGKVGCYREIGGGIGVFYKCPPHLVDNEFLESFNISSSSYEAKYHSAAVSNATNRHSEVYWYRIASNSPYLAPEIL